MKVLAVVPARSGSKGLPGKNIMEICGKPLIAWSIEAGLQSKYVNEVMLSTDCPKIAEIGIEYGATVPFLRPKQLAQDDSSTAEVLTHLITELEGRKEFYTHILLLEPTSPLRTAKDIDNAFELLINNEEAESIVGISQVESAHPSFCVSLEDKGFIRSKNNFQILRRQELEELYFYEGSVYISQIESYKINKNFYHPKTLGFKMPKWKSFEVDDYTDFIIIEALMNNITNLE